MPGKKTAPAKRSAVTAPAAASKRARSSAARRAPAEDDVADDAEESGDEQAASARTGRSEEAEEEEEVAESAAQKRLRLAQSYLAQLHHSLPATQTDAADADRDIIADRLQQDVETAHRRFVARAAELTGTSVPATAVRSLNNGHRLTVTSVALSDDNSSVYSASKDSSIVHWDVESGAKRAVLAGGRRQRARDAPGHDGHEGHILALAVTSDGRYLASGGQDTLIKIWDTRSDSLVDSFRGHRDLVTGLAFRQGTGQLVSGSHDRTVKLWDVHEMAYLDSLYGHQAPVTAVDALHKDRALSTSSDRSARLWKIADETQLVFRSPAASLDCASLFSDDRFLSGSQDGAVAMWNVQRKKPICSLPAAHGFEGARQARWITSVAALRYSDLAASGSSDGMVRLWQATNSALLPVLTVPVTGFINGLAFGKQGRFVVAAVGQEHRLGRWSRIQAARNGLRIIQLPVPD